MEKKCTKCKETKPFDSFYRNKSRPDGRSSECKECVKEYQRRRYEENPEKVRECSRRYREENPEKERERNRRYYEENLEKRREYDRRHYEENPTYQREYKRRYQEENRKISSALATKRGMWSEKEVEILLLEDGLTTLEKAIKLGRTHDSCKSKIKYLRKGK